MHIYDSRDPECKTPFGAVKTGETVTFSIRLPKTCNLSCGDEPMLLISEIDDGLSVAVPMSFCGSNFSDNIFCCKYVPQNPAVYFYHFEFMADGHRYRIFRDPAGAATIGEVGGRWQLTVYDSAMKAPDFLREGVMYQIFPDRFAGSGLPKQGVPSDRWLRQDWGQLPNWRANGGGEVLNDDYFGGDLKGIEQKLDYLERLGVTAVYLNPIFEAHSNHRYNTADYEKIDPLLGSNRDFEELAAAAKKRGISIILDGVFSHTGSDSVYFNKNGRYGESGAYRDPNSPYREWYGFSHYPDVYDCWWGFKTLPNVRETSPGYMEFICGENGVLDRWLRAGASGFRLDVADELPDEFLDALRERVKAFDENAAIIGEVWEDASTKHSYGKRRRYLLGRQLDSVMNYPFKDAVLNYIQWGDGGYFLGTVMHILENYPKPAIQCMMNFLSTHDTERAITTLAGEPLSGRDREWQARNHYLSQEDYERGCKLFKLASILQFGLPGIPCVYYGDEAGLSGYRDPFNRVCYPWGYENADLVEFIAALGGVRNDYQIFAEADFIPVTFNRDVCCFIRRLGKTAVIFAVNRSNESRRLRLPAGYDGAKTLVLAGGYENAELLPYSGAVLVKMGV